jgi:hypothetical protein
MALLVFDPFENHSAPGMGIHRLEGIAGVEIGMSRAAPDFRVTTGLTFLFKP